MAFNIGTPLKKTGASALTDIYRKKTEPNTWAGGSYGRGYAERMYGMNPSAFGYANGNVTINGNPLYKASLVNGKAMINDSQIPDYQKAIDVYAQRTGYATPTYKAEADPTYKAMQANILSGANRQALNALAAYSGGDTPDSASRIGSQQVYMDEISKLNELLPSLENSYYNRNQANREWMANQQQQKFANDTTIAGLTGMYNGKPTADQVYRDRAFAADQANSNRNYGLSAADNARADKSLAWQMSADNPDNIYKMQQIASSQNKVNYKTDPDFADELMSIKQDKDGFHNYLMTHVQDVIAKYGYDGFSELYNKSKPSQSGIVYSEDLFK